VKVLLSGSRGLIGSALAECLTERGDDVVPLFRGSAGPAGPGVPWDPETGFLDVEALRRAGPYDAAINLAGEPLGQRWTDRRRGAFRSSRVGATSLLARHLPELDPMPAVLVNASAVGFYGDRREEILTEQSAPGSGFLASLCADWEGAARAAEERGMRVVRLRTGIVLSTKGGALARQLPLFSFGLGGPLGGGQQFLSWITLPDEVAAIMAILDGELEGPVNVTAPEPVSNRVFAAALGRALHRPARLRAPQRALELALGAEVTRQMLLASQRVMPVRLLGAGYEFQHANLEAALQAALTQRF
jgi:uncharacterized protein (TIGR01777 family)